MKRIILTAALLGGFSPWAPAKPALSCARGVYRAGCAGPRGAVVTHRGYYRRPYHYHRGAVIYR